MFWCLVQSRHAKCLEPGNLVPGHFWSIIRTFFRNQRFKEMISKLCCGLLKNRFKWMPVLLQFYLKHNNVYTYNPLFKEYVQMNCSDICKSKSRFPEKNNLFACLLGTNIFGHLFSNTFDMNILGYISNKPYSPFFWHTL